MSTTLKTSTSPSSTTKSGFIIGPLADSLLIIGAPLVALVIAGSAFSLPDTVFRGSVQTLRIDLRQALIAIFVNAHLFLVFFRSHANPTIFGMYPVRFVAVPIALLSLGAMSPLALGFMSLVAVWWDVYHSSLQTFGFGRIYDSKLKNDATVGRSLDYWMNLLFYLGPVLAGAHFVDHLEIGLTDLQYLTGEGGALSELFLQRTPDFLQRHQTHLAVAILAVGVPFVVYYLYSYYRLHQRGYRVSWQKVWLMIITSAVSIYSWGFRSFIDAFWVMNFFHALQYFAIVSFAEHRNLSQVLLTSRFAHGGALAILWVCLFCFMYGLWTVYFAVGEWSVSLIVTTSLLHFWYDGFIWSVKKKQV